MIHTVHKLTYQTFLIKVNEEIIKLEFIEKAKILLKLDPYISISDLLAKHKVIKPIRGPRPTPKEIEDIGRKEIDERIKYLDIDQDINSVCTFLNN